LGENFFKLAGWRGGGGKSYDAEKAWSSINDTLWGELKGLNFPGASVRAENNRPLQVLLRVPRSNSNDYVLVMFNNEGKV
jgi:hypothetical protein